MLISRRRCTIPPVIVIAAERRSDWSLPGYLLALSSLTVVALALLQL